MTESSDIEKLVNYSVEYIEKLSADEEEYSDFHAYDPFRSNEARRLTRALIYTFHNQFITKRFKISDNIHSEWSIRPLEAMFMFLLRDDKYRKNVKAIINGKVKMVEKGFMNTITLYLNELTIPKK